MAIHKFDPDSVTRNFGPVSWPPLYGSWWRSYFWSASTTVYQNAQCSAHLSTTSWGVCLGPLTSYASWVRFPRDWMRVNRLNCVILTSARRLIQWTKGYFRPSWSNLVFEGRYITTWKHFISAWELGSWHHTQLSAGAGVRTIYVSSLISMTWPLP